jgi:hypothetical protein
MASLGQRMVGAMQGNAATFEEIEHDQSAMGQAVTVIIIAGVAALIGNIFRAGITAGMFALIASLVVYAIWAVIVTLVGTKLMPEPQTRADFAETFRTIAFAASPGVFNVLAIIPFLGVLISFAISLWSLVIMVIAVKVVLDYSNYGRAIIVVIIGWVVSWIVYFLIMIPYMGARMMMG